MNPNLIERISEANTLDEIDNIRRRYENSFESIEDRYKFYIACVNAMRKVILVQREKNKSFKKQLN
jgi:hypothetical protein